MSWHWKVSTAYPPMSFQFVPWQGREPPIIEVNFATDGKNDLSTHFADLDSHVEQNAVHWSRFSFPAFVTSPLFRGDDVNGVSIEAFPQIYEKRLRETTDEDDLFRNQQKKGVGGYFHKGVTNFPHPLLGKDRKFADMTLYPYTPFWGFVYMKGASDKSFLGKQRKFEKGWENSEPFLPQLYEKAKGKLKGD